MIRVPDYLRLRFAMGGRDRPTVDCWGLYRLIVGEQTGKWLAEFEGVESRLAIARTLAREGSSSSWTAVPAGEERELDLVLMRGLIGKGKETATAPMHVGCVTKPGWVLHIEESVGVLHQAFRSTSTALAHPNVGPRVLGIYRPEALA